MLKTCEINAAGELTLQRAQPLKSRCGEVRTSVSIGCRDPSHSQNVRIWLGPNGVVRSVKTFLKINQKDGFDCQGCAWPSPMAHATSWSFVRMARKPSPLKRRLAV